MNRRYYWFVLVAGFAALTTLVLVGDGWLSGQTADAQSISISSESFVYVLELAGQQVGEYTECSGLGSYHEIEEQAAITTGGLVVMESTPGVLRHHKIVLKRATPSNITIWQWRETMEDKGLANSLRDGRISLYGSSSTTPLAQWTFSNGWPASLVFDGSQEELVIVHEGLERVGASSSSGTTRASRAIPAGPAETVGRPQPIPS
jgi:phage tail-like protein